MMVGMTRPIDLVGMYLHLARASRIRQRPHVTDRFLVLAGVAAARLNLPRISAYCRRLILQHNPHHAVSRWESLEEALRDDDFLPMLRHLQRRFPLEKVEQMLHSLGIHAEGERQAYFTDEEYAAAVLGISVERLDEMSGDDAGNSDG
jgi:hypothetical protein